MLCRGGATGLVAEGSRGRRDGCQPLFRPIVVAETDAAAWPRFRVDPEANLVEQVSQAALGGLAAGMRQVELLAQVAHGNGAAVAIAQIMDRSADVPHSLEPVDHRVVCRVVVHVRRLLIGLVLLAALVQRTAESHETEDSDDHGHENDLASGCVGDEVEHRSIPP